MEPIRDFFDSQDEDSEFSRQSLSHQHASALVAKDEDDTDGDYSCNQNSPTHSQESRHTVSVSVDQNHTNTIEDGVTETHPTSPNPNKTESKPSCTHSQNSESEEETASPCTDHKSLSHCTNSQKYASQLGQNDEDKELYFGKCADVLIEVDDNRNHSNHPGTKDVGLCAENTTKAELNYRPSVSAAVYNDIDSETTSSSDSDENDHLSKSRRVNNDPDPSETNSQEKQNAKRFIALKQRVRSEGEVFPEELPPLEYLNLCPDETVELEPLGIISGVVDVLVVIRALDLKPALYDDSVLFLEDRSPLGLIFEIFGTVEKTFYSVRFNSHEDIKQRGLAVGDKVLYAPKADNFTKYVFIAELRKMKCDDASWENDNEPPPAALEFSDDEEERRVKREKRKSSGQKKKRKQQFSLSSNSDAVAGKQIPGLLEGDLRRNPFGDKRKAFNAPSSTQWPPNEPLNSNRNSLNGQQRMWQRVPFGAGGQKRPATFGEGPDWQHQPGVLSQTPHHMESQNFCNTSSPGSFFNNHQNEFNKQPLTFESFGSTPYHPGNQPFMSVPRGPHQYMDYNPNSMQGFSLPSPFPHPPNIFRQPGLQGNTNCASNFSGMNRFPSFNFSQPQPQPQRKPNFCQPPP